MTFEVYVWPAQWGLPSMDATCLSLIIYLQIAFPSQFTLVETINPDLSPSGQLPFIRHETETVASFSSILSYLRDSVGTSSIHASKTGDAAWLAHAESNLGNLVLHMFFSLHANWAELVHPSIVYRFPIPQRYYAPLRLQESYKSRLEAAGLWSLPGIEQEREKKKSFLKDPRAPEEEIKPKDRFLQVFEREKVLDKARTTLDLYARLLGSYNFFNGDRPSLLDAVVAAHILLLLRPPFPDPLLQDLVNNSYPSLCAHANRTYDQTLSTPLPARTQSVSSSLQSLIPPDWRGEQGDVWVTRLRFAFAGLTLGGMFTYMTARSRLLR
ncbi:hypothetical protein D9757_003701 [Collybiopsis confluens]|uniref:Mitochondrial outer membrane transport complex Sam37/metaxin N-terminal domain-containing protein n=1 Tax=Collybiopsis confluens TaxID=2823264 RepID=A0A8H5HUM2_9AGAR|nr:hypothetical protein D9757_003701 [Collybiopsis confluens]